MRTHKGWLTSTTLTLAVLANGVGALAQDKTRSSSQSSPEQKNLERRDVVITTTGAPFPPEALIGGGGNGYNFSFISSEMSFDNKVVKGEPYSAEAVTETTQTLQDGNRIVRKNTASVYRDGEGRTRREQAFNHIGPFATSGDAPQTIFINDPVAGVNYVLEPRSRTARKTAPFNFRSGNSLLRVPKVEGGASAVVIEPHGRARYPSEAKAANVEGDVAVRVVTNEAGEVVTATATEGPPLLRQAAVDLVKGWRVLPGNSRESSGKIETTVNFKFSLPDSVSYKFSLPGGRNYSFNFSERADGLPPDVLKRVPPALSPLGATVPGDVLTPFQILRQRIDLESAESHKGVVESLGKQTIEGVEAEGTRSTVTIPAGEIGNELPIKIVSERWYSPELQTVLMTKRSDPRTGENVYRLTNINRSEPARALFEVPADYTVKEGLGPNIQRFRMPRPNNDDK